jgi:hypothetical protein
MMMQPLPAPLERLAAVIRVGQPVVGAGDHVQGAGLGRALEESPPVRGRHHLVAVGLDHEHAGDAGGRLGPLSASHLGDEGASRLLGVGAG